MSKTLPWLIVSLLLPLTACSGGPEEGSSTSEDSTDAETSSLPLPTPPEEVLAGMAPIVQEQIRERQGWFQRLPADPNLDTARQAEAYVALGVLYQGYALVEPAKASFEKAEELSPQDPRWPYYLGHIHWRENRPEEAIERFQRSLELQPQNVPALVRLGEVLLEQNRPEEADERFAQALASEPGHSTALFNRGQIAAARGETEAAADFFQKALEADPEADSIHAALANVYRQMGNDEQARAELEQRGQGAVKMRDPLMERPYFLSEVMRSAFETAQVLFERRQYGQALQAYRQATNADPLFTVPRLRLAETLLLSAQQVAQEEGQGEIVQRALEEARRQLEMVLQIRPDHPQVHAQLALLDLRQGKGREAESHFRAALEADPSNNALWISLGNLLLNLGEPYNALEAFETVLAVDGGSNAAHLGKVQALLRLDRHTEAKEELEAQLTVDETDATLGHTLARLLATSEDPTVRDPERALAIAVAVYRDHPTALHGETFAMALAANVEWQEAIQMQEKLLKTVQERGDEGYARVLQANLERYRSQQGAQAIP